MDDNRKQAFDGWTKFLKPEVLKGNLITASIFLAAYETLCASVIGRLRDFYSFGFNADGPIIDEKYETQVLSLDKSDFRASLLWLKENSAIDDSDIAKIDQIRQHRNDLAHELPKYLLTANTDIDVNLLVAMYDILTRIDRWWIQEVELPTNPDYDGIEIADDDIISGSMLFIQMMIRIATGADSAIYWEEFQKQAGSVFV